MIHPYKQQSTNSAYRVQVKNIHPLTLVSKINSALEEISNSI